MRSSTSTSDWPHTLLGALAGSLALVLALELLFRVLPVSTATKTGYYFAPALLSYPPHHQWRVATGWDLRNSQRLQSNNFGWLADGDFVADEHAVALVGDSYVEAAMLDAADRPAAQLRHMLGSKRAVYALGGPGSSLLDYAERIRFVRERLDVRDYVVLMEAGDVRQALCGSGNVHSACLDRQTFAPRTERRPEPSVIKRVLRESALAQYLSGQLKIDGQRLLRDALSHPTPAQGGTVPAVAERAAAVGAVPPAPPFVDIVTNAFFERVAPFVDVGHLVIIVDGQRVAGEPYDNLLTAERNRFIALARHRGARVVDGEPLYAAHAATSRLSLQVGPYDAHLNRLGVKIVMSAAADELRRSSASP